jgi:3-oxoacyl-[acyl-carrier protein] reductase
VSVADLTGRVALVTGANHGIGAATARLLATCGAAVLVSYLRLRPSDDPGEPEAYGAQRAADGETLAEAIRTAGGRAAAVEADLSDPTAPARLFDAAERELGPVDILINNASGWRADTFAPPEPDRFGRRLDPVSAETFAAQFLVDARAGALLIAELGRRHAARGASWGRIVSLTSGGPFGFPQEASYGAAKAALENYTMTAAAELGRFGITANILYPPVTDTGWITEEVERFATADSPFGRVGTPEEVAAAIALLLRPEADRVTGTLLRMR